MKTGVDLELQKSMDDCIQKVSQIMNQLDPAARLVFMNELIVRIMPERKKPKAAAEKISKQQRKPLQSLSDTQLKLINKLADDTDRLFFFDGDHRA